MSQPDSDVCCRNQNAYNVTEPQNVRIAEIEYIRVKVKMFKFDAHGPAAVFDDNHAGHIRGDKNYSEDITEGHVYMFVEVIPPWSTVARTEFLVRRQRITKAGDAICIPQNINRADRPVHFAYSKDLLSDDRIETIKQSILDNLRRGGDRRNTRGRTQYISTQQLFPYRVVSQDYLTPHYLDDDGDNGTIYLYDWNGYLEKSASGYYDMVQAGHEGYEGYLGEEVDLTGDDSDDAAGSGLTRGELYSFTDKMDTLVTESERRGRRNWFPASLREELKRSDDADVHNMYRFYNDARAAINDLRSGGQPDEMNGTIRLISFLLADRRANSAFLDYMFDTQERAGKLIERIGKCLHRWEETLHKEEKERLLKAWEAPTLPVSRRTIPPLTEELDGNAPATARQTHRHIGEDSVFLYMEAGVGVAREKALPPEIWDILGIWFSAELTNRDRLIIHSLAVAGIFKGRPEVEVGPGVVYRRNERTRLNIVIFGSRVTGGVGAADGLGILQMPKIVADANKKVGAVLKVHNFLAEMQMGTQMLNEGQAGWAIPHFASAGQSAVLVAAVKGSFAAGVAVGSFFSAVRAFASFGMVSRSSGDIRVRLAYVFSGVSYTASFALATTSAVRGMLAKRAGLAATRGGAGIFIAVASALAGGFLMQLADARARDRVRLMLRHSIWGAGDGRMPDRERDSGALLGRWWPELGGNADIEAEILPLVFSNKRTDVQEWHNGLMQPNVGDSLDKIRETFLRNSHLLNVVTQLPSPLPSLPPVSRHDPLLGGHNFTNHRLIEINGLQNFLLMERVDITLSARPPGGRTPREYRYSRDTSGGDRDLLALFRTGGDRAISDWDNAILADRIAVVFFGDDLRTANGRAHQEIADNPRYVEVCAQEARHIERIEMLIQYYSLDDVPALLPVRFEHEFIRS